MKAKHILYALIGTLASLSTLSAQAVQVSICTLQEKPEKFLNVQVEVNAIVREGVEYPRLAADGCSFRFARGDDYQSIGHGFPVDQNEQWAFLIRLLSTSGCASNVRVAKARIKGTVIRVPPSGTMAQNEMPFEIIIQSVSAVSSVPIKCAPRDN